MFKVSSGGWEIIVSDVQDYNEAVLKAAIIMYDKFKQDLNVSYIFIVENILTEEIELIAADAVMQDLELYELAYTLKSIIEA